MFFLQGNLPLEFKESGTLLGKFWRGIWNWEDCFWLEDLKKRIRRKEERKIGDFVFFRKTNLGLEGWYIYVRKGKKRGGRYWSLEREEKEERTSKKEDFYLGIVLRRKRKDSQQPSHYNQSCPGMHRVAFGILIYILFFRVFDSWVFDCLVDFCVDEKGHNLLCWDWLLACLPCFDFGCH